MKIQLNYGDVDHSDALSGHIERAIEKAMHHVADRITRIEVHLRDDKQKRTGPDDKRCTMEARIAGEPPLAVEAKADDMYKAVSECAAKLERAVTRKLDRLREA